MLKSLHHARLILQRYSLALFRYVSGPKSSCKFFRQSDSQIQLKFFRKKIYNWAYKTF